MKTNLLDDSAQAMLEDYGKLQLAAKLINKQPAVPYVTAKEAGVAEYLEKCLLNQAAGITKNGKEDNSTSIEDLAESWRSGQVVLLFGIGDGAIGVMSLH